MAQWRFVEWLLVWLLRTRNFQFEWDQGNSTKNFKKPNVSTAEKSAHHKRKISKQKRETSI